MILLSGLKTRSLKITINCWNKSVTKNEVKKGGNINQKEEKPRNPDIKRRIREWEEEQARKDIEEWHKRGMWQRDKDWNDGD